MNKKLLTSLIFLSVAVGFSNPALAGTSLKQRFNDFINNTNIAPDIAIPSENGDIKLIQLSEQDFDTAAEEEESTKVASNKFLNFFKPKSKEQQEENNVEVKAGSDIDVVQVDDESKDIEKLKPAEENPKVSEEKEKKKFRLFGRKDKNNKEEVKKTTEETPVIQPRDAFEGEQVVDLAVGEEIKHLQAVESRRIDVHGVGGEVDEGGDDFLVSLLGGGDVVRFQQVLDVRQRLRPGEKGQQQ